VTGTVQKLHHARLRVRDVEEAAARWSLLYGLTREPGTGLLRCAYEDFSLELVPAGDAPPGLEHTGYELRAGVRLEDVALFGEGEVVDVPVRGRGLRLTDPDGNGVLLVERARDPDGTPPVARFTDVLPAFRPRRIQHVNYLTADVPRMVAWYERIGFAVTDWIGDEGCWLHVDRDHHVLALLDKGFAHVHHLAFELVDWGEFRIALDHLGQHGRWTTWGPGRHAMAQNLFAYLRMAEEDLFVELFSDMEQLEPDHVVRHFPDDPHASNVWGQLPPRTYFRFDAEAIEAEKHQLAALGQG
jgi:catechol 2,3-dioxygenase-like lactoylglutathione lyase family enzyme